MDLHALPQGPRLSRHVQGPQKQERFSGGQESAVDRRRSRGKRIHGDNDQSLQFNSLVELDPPFWNGLALNAQRKIIKDLKEVTLEALGEELGESNKATIAQQVIATPVDPNEQKIAYSENGLITIPSVAYSNPSSSTREVLSMKSFGGGMQVFLPRFSPEGLTVMRGGTWKGEANACASGSRMLSGGYGRYENWGLRAAITPPEGKKPAKELTLDLGDGVTMEFLYAEPGTFVMGGENEKGGRFECVEVPSARSGLDQGLLPRQVRGDPSSVPSGHGIEPQPVDQEP